MTVLERRKAIIKVLNVRRYEKIANLMSEFGVCRRTIVTDINEISRVYPIYTSQGARGGIYVVEGATLLVEKKIKRKTKRVAAKVVKKFERERCEDYAIDFTNVRQNKILI